MRTEKTETATNSQKAHQFSKKIESALFVMFVMRADSAPPFYQEAAQVLALAVGAAPIATAAAKAHVIKRKMAGLVATRKQLSGAAEARDLEKAIELVARLWYHALIVIPLIPRVDAALVAQYVADDLRFIINWATTGEPGSDES